LIESSSSDTLLLSIGFFGRYRVCQRKAYPTQVELLYMKQTFSESDGGG
jgi:hypothetical protein